MGRFNSFLCFKKKIIYLFIYFCLRWVFIAARGLSLVALSGGYSSLRCTSFSLWWLLLLRSTGSRHVGFSSCGMRAQKLWRTGLVAPRHVESSWSRDWTHVPCIGRWILNHCATREVPHSFLWLGVYIYILHLIYPLTYQLALKLLPLCWLLQIMLQWT